MKSCDIELISKYEVRSMGDDNQAFYRVGDLIQGEDLTSYWPIAITRLALPAEESKLLYSLYCSEVTSD
jgi:hypothetical protein